EALRAFAAAAAERRAVEDELARGAREEARRLERRRENERDDSPAWGAPRETHSGGRLPARLSSSQRILTPSDPGLPVAPDPRGGEARAAAHPVDTSEDGAAPPDREVAAASPHGGEPHQTDRPPEAARGSSHGEAPTRAATSPPGRTPSE